jgi:hypothetical protein
MPASAFGYAAGLPRGHQTYSCGILSERSGPSYAILEAPRKATLCSRSLPLTPMRFSGRMFTFASGESSKERGSASVGPSSSRRSLARHAVGLGNHKRRALHLPAFV